jgi:hypothetical protein
MINNPWVIAVLLLGYATLVGAHEWYQYFPPPGHRIALEDDWATFAVHDSFVRRWDASLLQLEWACLNREP